MGVRRVVVVGVVAGALILGGLPVGADTRPRALPFFQDWANTGLITASDDWSGVAGVIGFRGDGLSSANDVDPQTVLGEGTPVIDVNANQTDPDTFTTGGVTEFHLPDPTVALTGSARPTPRRSSSPWRRPVSRTSLRRPATSTADR